MRQVETAVVNSELPYDRLLVRLYPVQPDVYNVAVLVGRQWLWLCDPVEEYGGEIGLCSDGDVAGIFTKAEAIGLLNAWQQQDTPEEFIALG